MNKVFTKFFNILKFPGAYLNTRRHRNSVKGKPVENVFTEIYQNNFWGDEESVSGSGSNEEQTRVIVEKIPELLEKYKITSLLDLPCGDFNWMRKLDLSKIKYTVVILLSRLLKEIDPATKNRILLSKN